MTMYDLARIIAEKPVEQQKTVYIRGISIVELGESFEFNYPVPVGVELDGVDDVQ